MAKSNIKVVEQDPWQTST